MKEITFNDIQKANETIITTDIKGKDYAEVNQRIKAFRMVYPTGTIETKMLSNENGVCIFRAMIVANGYILATGTAYEKENSTFINKTSYIENCETSAVGRALGMCGFGIDTSVASAEEVQNAIANQVTTKEEAENYVINFGKHSGKTLKEICDVDINYIDWLFNSEKTDQVIKQCITLITGVVEKSQEEKEEILNLTVKLNELVREKNVNYEKLLKHYNVKSNTEMTLEQLRDAVSKLESK